MKLDETDLSILKVLTQDGRASLREVAARTSLSTPTVSFRLARMLKARLIRGFVPVIDPSASRQVMAFVRLKVPGSRANVVASKLARLGEVSGVYFTTGKENLTIRVSSENVEGLQRFLSGRHLRQLRGEVVSSTIVTRTLKEEQAPRLARGVSLNLRCDYCRGEVATNRPYNLRVASTMYYFCCRTCRHSYIEKNRSKIHSVRLRMGSETTLHS